jgi:fatty-acyl-CoA synthase
MIVSGGENVYPHEVEDLLSSHPLLTEVAVVVQDDEEFGRRMSAVVVPKAGANLDSDQIRLWLKERLERSKMPRTIRLLEEIPKNALGKVDRAALCRLCQEAE